uniref:CDP-alcohol phosphatidyltransferase n=1 Tax=viral metagenome TaxID=1070528 RepID=A0A6C0F3T8_9ZZZZ
MRKIHENLENPFDNAIYIIVEYLAPYAHKFGFTPNMITTISNIFAIIAIYYLIKHYFVVSGILYLISYMFDCLDGYVARKYNMVTIFGDYYDHISDAVKFIAYLGTLYLINSKLLLLFLPILIYIGLLTYMQIASQELYYGKQSHSPSLSILNKFVGKINKETAEENLKYYRYFGCGTFNFLVAIISIVYGCFYRNY